MYMYNHVTGMISVVVQAFDISSGDRVSLCVGGFLTRIASVAVFSFRKPYAAEYSPFTPLQLAIGTQLLEFSFVSLKANRCGTIRSIDLFAVLY